MQYTVKHWELTDEGKDVAANGSHEARVFNVVPPEGIAQAEIMVCTTWIKTCISFDFDLHSGHIYINSGHRTYILTR